MLKMSSQHSFTIDTVLPVSGSEIDTRDCPNWNSTMSVQLSIHDCFQCYERMNSCTPTATQVKTKIMKQSKAAPWISVYIVELIFMNVIVYVIGVARTENNHCFSSLFVHYYYHIHGALHYAEATNLCSNLSLSLSLLCSLSSSLFRCINCGIFFISWNILSNCSSLTHICIWHTCLCFGLSWGRPNERRKASTNKPEISYLENDCENN